MFVKGNSGHYLHQYRSPYSRPCTAFCLVLLVRVLFFSLLLLWLYQTIYNCFSLFLCRSFGGAIVSAIHKHELDEKPVHHRGFAFLGPLDPGLLQGIHCRGAPRTSSHQSRMGNKKKRHTSFVGYMSLISGLLKKCCGSSMTF